MPTTERNYTIAEDGKSITCHFCGRTSHNQNDVTNLFCGKCRVYHEAGFDTGREEVMTIAEQCLKPVIGRKGYILLFIRPTEDPRKSTIQAATNLTPADVRSAIAQFLTSLYR